MTTERDPSATDVTWNKYTIRGEGFITADALGFSPANSSAALQFLKNSLQQPRRAFFYAQGATVIINIGNPLGPAIDAKLGPEPLPTVVHEVTSGQFRVETGVIVRLAEGITETDHAGNAFPPNPVVSLRWSQTENFDEDWYSHLSTEGRLIVRSDLLQSADNFRPLATPPILPDYQRMRSKYTLSPDGLELAFNFEDTEKDRLPPFPATSASGRFVVVISKGGLRTGAVSIKLTGQKGTSRRDLLVKATAMAYAKLRADGFQSTATPIIWGTFGEDLFIPSVDVQMQAMLSPVQKKGGAVAPLTLAGVNLARRAGIVPSPGPQIMPSVGLDTFGLASNKNGIAPPERKRIAGLLTAAFSDPCACLLSDVSLSNAPVPIT